MVSVAASRYARALLDVVLAPNSGLEPGQVIEQLRAVESLIAGSGELRHVMMSPAVAAVRKRGVIGQFAGQLGLAPKMRNFFYVLVDHRRIGQIAQIREGFEQFLDEALGFVRADVASAEPLTDAQRQALQSELAKVAGKQVRIEIKTDPALVGGVVARIGSTVYDGSVRGQLEALRLRLATQA